MTEATGQPDQPDQPDDMHHFRPALEGFARDALAFALHRARSDIEGVPLGRPCTPAELDAAAGPSITEDGLGPDAVLRIFTEILEPACLSVDFPRYFAFIPAAPTETAILADAIVGACSIYAGSWLEGAGAVWAENQALRWVSDLAGLPAESGGCFVSGGTVGNLSALVAARHSALSRRGGRRPDRWAVVVGPTAHASVKATAEVVDAEVVVVPGERLTGAALAPVLAALGDRVCAVVATAGSTNLGLVDDLASVADACGEAGVWFHVDGAYGLAALAAPSARARFDGIERADSLIVDPHKWLFAPFDTCVLLYRDPSWAKAVHTQHGAYLEVLHEGGDWNPSDYAVHLTRRARGVPFWFSLAAHGTRAYAEAIEHCLTTSRAAADLIRQAPLLDLVVEPELSVVAFRRRGWAPADYVDWSRRLLESGEAFVVPSTHAGHTILRLCIVNPRTTVDEVRSVLATLA